MVFKRSPEQDMCLHSSFGNISTDPWPDTVTYKDCTPTALSLVSIQVVRIACFSTCTAMVWSSCGSNDRKYRVATNLENTENLENSGNLKNCQTLRENSEKFEFL